MTDKVTFIEVTDPLTNDVTEHAMIDHGNGEFTSMPKAIYDAQLAAQDTLPSKLSIPSTPQAGA
jgi:hypothetical protein